MKTHPSLIKLGALVSQHGYTMKVERICLFCYTEDQLIEAKKHSGAEIFNRINPEIRLGRGDDLITYSVKGSFVDGDKKMFNYFRNHISAGEKCGQMEEFSTQQGNSRATWYVN